MDYKKEYERYKAYAAALEKENLSLTMRLSERAIDKPIWWEQVVRFQAEKRLDIIKHFEDLMPENKAIIES